MQRKSWSHAARAAAVGWGLIGPTSHAHASVVQYTYTGTVGYGYDRAGIFGSDETLTGDTFTLIERFDTGRNAYRYVDTAQSLQFGGATRGVADSASLTVTIGGVSRNIADLEDYIYSGSVTGKHFDFVKDQTGYEYAGFYVESPFLSADYGAALTLDPTRATFIGNYQFFSGTDPQLATYASFDVQSLTVGPVSTVPLPSGIALLGTSLLGLGLAAWVRRPKRQDVAKP